MTKYILIQYEDDNFIVSNDKVYKLIYEVQNQIANITIEPIKKKYDKEDYPNNSVLLVCDKIHHVICDYLNYIFRLSFGNSVMVHFNISTPELIESHLLFGPITSSIRLQKMGDNTYLIKVFDEF